LPICRSGKRDHALATIGTIDPQAAIRLPAPQGIDRYLQHLGGLADPETVRRTLASHGRSMQGYLTHAKGSWVRFLGTMICPMATRPRR